MKQAKIDGIAVAIRKGMTVPEVMDLIEAIEDAPNILVATIEKEIGDAGFFREAH